MLNLWVHKILKIKGSGGYADVYKAINRITGQTVAIKELRWANSENRLRFQRERDMLTIYKDSPYFPDLYESFLDNGQPFLIMEYSSTGSLHQFVGKLTDWRRAARWMIDIAHALEEMQTRGDLHRDLKPGNMLLFSRKGGGEIVKLIDFGLAHRPDNPSGPGTNSVYGTEGYIDPVAKRSGHFFREADIYSVGRTMKALFTGSPDGALFRSIPGPSEFRDLIESMMDLDVTKRPTPMRIYQTLERLLTPSEEPTDIPSINWGLILKASAAALAFAALFGNEWDDKAQRYRKSNGQFASGWLS
jgi:serine/threonine protein kinase